MEIRPNLNVDSVARVLSTSGQASRPVQADEETSAFESSRALEARLNDVSDVRPEKVEQARRLIGDPAYPPRETLQRLAALLALNQADPSAAE
jgi:hypothetical protein